MKRQVVRDVDKGWNRIQQMFNASRVRYIAVGLLEPTNARSDSSIPNAYLGSIHEFGLGVPERSFLRRTFDEKQESYFQSMKIRAGMILAGRLDPETTLDKLGVKVKDDIQATIQAGVPPALAEATVARKGSSKTLIDSGQLVQAITFEQRSE